MITATLTGGPLDGRVVPVPHPVPRALPADVVAALGPEASGYRLQAVVAGRPYYGLSPYDFLVTMGTPHEVLAAIDILADAGMPGAWAAALAVLWNTRDCPPEVWARDLVTVLREAQARR